AAHPARHGRLPGAQLRALDGRAAVRRDRAAAPGRGADQPTATGQTRHAGHAGPASGRGVMNTHSTVVVVGGGVIGCAVAYYAARRGLDVTLVDVPKRGRATSASAGGLWPMGESVGLGCRLIFANAPPPPPPHHPRPPP